MYFYFRLNFLDRRLQAGMPSSRGEDWQPLLLYRNSLLHGETDQVPVTIKRAYTRRKRDHLAGIKFYFIIISICRKLRIFLYTKRQTIIMIIIRGRIRLIH